MVAKKSGKSAGSFSNDMVDIKSTILGSVTGDIIKKIILFGSYAYGKPNKNSDIDLCVIVADKKKQPRCLFKYRISFI